MVEPVPTGRNRLAGKERNGGSGDELPFLFPRAIEGDRQYGLEDRPAAGPLVTGGHVAIREVEVELREQRPDVRERVRELLAGLGDITNFGRCYAAVGSDRSLLST